MKKIPPMLLKTEFKEKDEWWSMKMIGNTVFAIADKPHVDILILSKNLKTFEWPKNWHQQCAVGKCAAKFGPS